MVVDTRRAQVRFELSSVNGAIIQSGAAGAVIGDDALGVGPVTVSFLDADELRIGDYRIELEVWPDRHLVLSDLGRRFDAFVQELRRARNQARVVGLLAHGITPPDVFTGVLLAKTGPQPAEFQVYDTHVTVVSEDGDPWQLALGAISAVIPENERPGIVLETHAGPTVLGQLGRQRDACLTAIAGRRDAQLRFLAELTGVNCFSDGWGAKRSAISGFDRLIEKFTASDRASSCHALLNASAGEPAFGFVQLLDPDGERLRSDSPLPDPWASFLLVPVNGGRTAMEILDGPSAATYVFRGSLDAVNRDLQLLHFRRAALAITPEQALVTPINPQRLALRKLDPLLRLRAATTARITHHAGWENAFAAAIA